MGQATFVYTFVTEGSRTITATYSGATGFATSSGSITQVVNNITTVTGNTFCNTGSITLNDGGTGGQIGTAATPYPSNIFVSGLSGTIQSITVDLKGVVHTKSRDIDLLLVAPTGQKFLMMTGVGDRISDGFTGTNFIPIPSNLTLSDAAVSALPRSSVISSGTYRPASYERWPDTFPAPAPAGPYNQAAPVGSATFASVFNGLDPNGTWQLFATDDTIDVTGSIANGWCLNFVVSPPNVPTTTTVTSDLNPSLFGNNVTFTATVLSGSNPVTLGTVTFTEGATTLAANVALNGSGQASFSISTLAEGSHTITATYSGATGFATSSGTVTQVVNNIRIRDIQSVTHISPYNGQVVANIPGIVTAVRNNGFYLQDPNPDADDATSEGIFVFTSSAPTVSVGNAIKVTGTVTEFRQGGNSAYLNPH
ncbi:MAG: Ig-like domain repeat protein [Haliscomenobacter sp.]|nr:Ig-like domain repeat protein [Haliscomenobacter sp.]MBK9492021.1 Ig-like domain repeat protein [Haliscomenobacter sp.]